MASMLQKRVSDRARMLQLGADSNIPAAGVTENVPLSPTDVNLSPASKKIWGKRRPSAQDMHQEVKARRWESLVEPSDDGSPANRALSESEGEESSDSDEEVEVEEVKGNGEGVFFSAPTELALTPRPPPTPLKIVLGSSSQNRKQVLQALEWEFTSMSPDIDEKSIRDSDPHELPLKIAKAKAEALLPLVDKPCILITADQICEFQDSVREKPRDQNEAREFLRSYSGQHVFTVSAVVATNTETGQTASGIDIAKIVWTEIPEEVIERVVGRGLIMQSAGGFVLADPDLKPLVVSIDGSVDSVYGLPVHLLFKLINRVVEI